MDKKQLNHSGIKGMKWGIRRFQNKDGSLTPEGKKRYDREISELSEKKKKNYKADPNKWATDDLRSSKKVVDEASNLTNRLKTATDSSINKSKKKTLDLSSMSDQQMRNEINRALLERQYNDMFAPAKVSRGKEIASKTLDVVGTVLGVSGSALGIALAIKELKG